ncbi:hypothetical protein POPTR_018G056301v4 [Populus trichocarpa]|uniref:Uncharacterized protein n=1 Tax=Populus trichocarpa TaxID=3694 RepID=A0A3N7G8N0_POPTR|nr:hypothetical protein BDE02_18G045400 [Populus trichocarpa]RQP02696.2 hypothetical protein POPTR_018G056301v4 [Populus trichocarpa]
MLLPLHQEMIPISNFRMDDHLLGILQRLVVWLEFSLQLYSYLECKARVPSFTAQRIHPPVYMTKEAIAVVQGQHSNHATSKGYSYSDVGQ